MQALLLIVIVTMIEGGFLNVQATLKPPGPSCCCQHAKLMLKAKPMASGMIDYCCTYDYNAQEGGFLNVQATFKPPG